MRQIDSTLVEMADMILHLPTLSDPLVQQAIDTMLPLLSERKELKPIVKAASRLSKAGTAPAIYTEGISGAIRRIEQVRSEGGPSGPPLQVGGALLLR